MKIEVSIEYCQVVATCQRAPLKQSDFESRKEYVQALSQRLMNALEDWPQRSVGIEIKIFKSLEEFEKAVAVQFRQGFLGDLLVQKRTKAIFPTGADKPREYQVWKFRLLEE